MPSSSSELFRAVAARIEPGMRVGVDGVSGAGKTTFADRLARFVDGPVVRASVDGFHRPRVERYARGEGPKSYYEDTFDLARLRTELLEPFARGDPVRLAIFDHVRDLPLDDPPRQTLPGSVLLVDGVFLHRPELRGAFDLTIWLAVEHEIALERAIARDAEWTPAVRERYAARYVPAETRYVAETAPARLAGLVVENTDPAHPRLVVDSNP